MKAADFVKSKIDSLVSTIPFIKCSYEFDQDAIVHLIKVEPLNVYKSNEKYLELESEIIFDFIEQYPYENICFVSNSSLVSVNNPSYVKCGNSFVGMNFVQVSNMDIIQIGSNQKISSFKQGIESPFSFWDESKTKNNINVQAEYLGNTSHAMAA